MSGVSFVIGKLGDDSAGCSASSESAALISGPVVPVMPCDQPMGPVTQPPWEGIVRIVWANRQIDWQVKFAC